MVHCCAAYNCTERYRKGGVSFHSFPANPELREKWRKAVRRLNFKPTDHSKLCAKHFTPDCYETTPWSFMKRLKDGAIPTIFQFSPMDGKKCKISSTKKQEESHTERHHEQPNEEIQGIVSSSSTCKSSNGTPSSQIPKIKSVRKKEHADDDVLSVSVEEKDSLNNRSFSNVSNNESKTVKNDLLTATNESESSLPAKRSRKKKIFFGDFISEDWMSKGKRCSKKGLGEDDVDLSRKGDPPHDLQQLNKHKVIQICDKDSDKSSESKGEKSSSSDKDIENGDSLKLRTLCKPSSNNKTVSLEQKNILSANTHQKRTRGGPKKVLLKDSEEVLKTVSAREIDREIFLADSCSESDQCNSFLTDEKEVHEVYKSVFVEQNINPSKSLTPKETRGRVRKILLDDPNDALLVLPKLNISRSSSDESCSKSKQKNPFNSDEREISIVNSQKKQSPSEDTKVSKETKQDIQLLENVRGFVENTGTDNRDDLNVNQEKLCPNKTVLLLPLEISEKMSCSIEINVENGPNVQNNVNCSDVSNSHSFSENIIPINPNSSDKLSSVMKLKNDKKEGILNQTLLPDKHNNNEKALKVIDTDKISVTSANSQNSNSLSTSSNEKTAEISKPLKRKSYIGDFKAEDFASPEKAAKCFNVAQNIIKEKDKRIKYLRQRERRLMKKVEELENVIFHLVEKKVNPEDASTVLIVLKDKD